MCKLGRITHKVSKSMIESPIDLGRRSGYKVEDGKSYTNERGLHPVNNFNCGEIHSFTCPGFPPSIMLEGPVAQ
jgi:hypothetical protein